MSLRLRYWNTETCPYDTASSSQPGKPAALEVGCDYACIAWDKPVKSDLEYYEVKLKITGDECWFKMPIFTRDNTPYKRVADLMPEIQYEFKVRGHYQEDEGQFSEKSDPVLTKQSSMFKDGSSDTTTSNIPSRKPGKLCSLAVGRDFTDLRWDAPEDRNVSYYELKSKRTRSQAWDKMPVFTEDAKTFLRVTNLLPTTCYVFKVRAHFQDDEGPFSDVSDIIATSGDVENTDERENVLSVVKFQGKCSPTDEDNFSIPSEGLTWYRSPRQTDGGYCADYLRMGQGHRMVTEPRSLSSTNVLPIRKEDYLFHGPFLETFPSSEGSTTKSLTAHYSNQTRNDSQVKHSNRPGKPTRSDSGSDFIRLIWVAPDDKNVLYYEVKNKLIQDELWSKNSATTTDDSSQIFVRGLLQDTEYTFKVRAHYKNGEGDFSGQSDAISTLQSPALSVRNVCVKLQGGEPAFYKLPLKENMDARSTEYKTRKCEFGSSDRLQEKTIMMIGATGSGKSTLIDGMVNHLLGVKWADDFRFKIIDLMTEEEAKRGLETESQTDWITSYRVHPMNRTVKFICNIIDTPGFGDTRGIERDHQLVDQIRAFFDTKGVKGIETIDAVCFVTQAPLARLTQTQRYIYDSILSIFGKDMKENLVAMVTFADGKEPPVLNALMQAAIPTKKHFIFNNSALFESNTDSKCNRFGKMFWEMGFTSYDGFFNFLPSLRTQSLQLTAEVLNKREQLNATVQGLLPQIDQGLIGLATMKSERELVDKYEREIKDNQNFTYEISEFRQKKVNLRPGEYVTNCTFCHSTCHYPCGIPDDNDKAFCAAMCNGKCRVCPQKCGWQLHRNNDFRIEVTEVKVTKSYEEMKKKLEIAKEGKVTKQHILRSLGDAFLKLKDTVCQMMDKVRDCGNYLRNNAIKINPLTELEYLDVLIESERQQRKPGFYERVKMLRGLKRSAEFKAKSIHLTPQQILKDMGLQDMHM
ncbi:uncharacterized protein LOC117315267 [Pecten maximus]|uniref:uncharacterized protein LOC117315267 n=1 Tax=Pecten maximus TaxID=6579 RepID=UPI001459146B|nr:uncharacterized protein LOC117315267 [Pecten maximus]